MMNKNNFILYKDFKPTLELLTNEQSGRLFKAIYNYVEDRTEPQFKDGMLIMAFSVLKTQLERDLIKYKNKVERNKINGAKGGRPTNKEVETQSVIKNPSGYKKTSKVIKKPKKADSDSVSDSVRDSDSKKTKAKKVYFDNEELNTLFYEFILMRKKIKKPMTDKAIELAIGKLNKQSDNIKTQMLEYSIMNNYQGLFIPKEETESKQERKFGNG